MMAVFAGLGLLLLIVILWALSHALSDFWNQ